MALNYIWVGFFLIAFVIALAKLIFLGDTGVFPDIVQSTFSMAKTGFEISLYLTGVMALWLGIMKIGENGGAVRVLSKIVGPFFNKLFPEVPKEHPANGAMLMNFSANMLGLDNAATPLGLKAMKELQELNPEKEKASNAQIMFLVLNTSGLTIIPASIMALRAAKGAANPSDIFLPILIATYFSSLAGLIAVSIFQKINLFNKTILAYLVGTTTAIAGLIYFMSGLSPERMEIVSGITGNLILFSIIIAFILLGLRSKVNIYDSFIDGAKEGFQVAIGIIPYLVAMLVAIGVFRASGAMDLLVDGIRYAYLSIAGLFVEGAIRTDFIEALPTAFMKPLSGSGARGMMVEAMETHGVDSFVGRLASTFQGSTETTFYTLAVYYGAVKISNTRYTVTAGLIADFVGIITAIFVAYLFFG